MAEIELKSKKLPLKLHKFESKCLQRCLLFQSKLNLEKSINSSHGNVGIKHLFCLKNQNLKFFDEINDTIPDIDLIMSNYDKENLSCINVTKQNFPINMSNIKQIELFSEKALFLLEVELDSDKNEEINRLKYILQDYAKLNFELVTNARGHEIKIFESDLRIQLNGYQIIKAIQIRLENYKKDILNKSTIGQKIDLLTSIQDNNFNINFLFSSQKILNIDKYQTNVNNIMNSGFEIKKLFIEFDIPLSKFSRETQVGNQDCFKEKNEYIIDKNTIREICYDKSRNLKKPVISTNFKLNYGNDSNASTCLNKFDIIKKNKTSDEKKKSSREIKYNKNYFGGVNNQINYFEGVNENIRNSNIYNNTFVPNTQPFTHFTAQSPLYSQPYVYNNVNNNHYDQYYNNGYGNYYINNNYMSNRNPHLNYMMRYNNNTNVNKMKIYHQPNVMLNLNTNIYNNVKNSKNLCNWHVFMTNSTPLIYDTDELSLREFFNFYDKPSVIGLGCILKSKCRKILCSYLPTLSSLYVELINSSYDQVNSSFSSMSSKKTDTNLNAENQSNKIVSGFRNQANNFNLPLNTSNLETLTYHSNSTVESLFLEEENFLFEKKKKSDNMTSVINFTEDQILFNRQVLTSRLDELYKKYPELDTATLGDISENSYFSLLWTPIKSLNLLPINTSFLVYYKFRNKQFSYSIKFLNVLGVTSNKCDEDFWFTNQILIETSIMNEVIMNLLAEDFLRNKHQFYQYKESLQKLVMMKKVNSIDYNFLIK